MGSSFSIRNDTQSDIWVWNGAAMAYVTGAIGGVLTVASFGTFAAAGILAAGTISGLAPGGISLIGWALSAGSGAVSVAGALGITEPEAEKIRGNIKKFIDGANQKLSPGETYEYSASLSLVRSIWLMNEHGVQVKRDCWTGATANSNRSYTVRRDWDWP